MFRRRQRTTFDPLRPEMVAITGSEFLMGTDAREVRQISRRAHGDRAAWYTQEQPQHPQTLDDFAMGRFPVTVGEFAAFIEIGGYDIPELWGNAGWQWRIQYRVDAPAYWGDPRWTNDAMLPIIGVSWYEATAYCAWLAAETGEPYRLPTEVQWEKAARGTDARRYPWGSRWQASLCNTATQVTDSWDSPRKGHTAALMPVGQFSPKGDSPYGCADMAGNVWEWCDSTVHAYPLRAAKNTAPINTQEPRIVRGGSWYDGPEDARCAARYCFYPHGRDNVVGFRLAL